MLSRSRLRGAGAGVIGSLRLLAVRRYLVSQQLVVQADEALGRGRLGGFWGLGAQVGLQEAEGGADGEVAHGVVAAAPEDAVFLHRDAFLDQLERLLGAGHDQAC